MSEGTTEESLILAPKIRDLLYSNERLNATRKEEILRFRNDLEDRLAVLDIERDRITREIENTVHEINIVDAIFAPFRCIPTEILVHIFNFCLVPKLSSEAEKTFRILTSVTSLWRNVIFGTAQFLRSIYISCFCDNIVPNKQSPLKTMLTNRILLAKGGPVSLAIEILHDSRVKAITPRNLYGHGAVDNFISSLLKPHVDVIKHIYLTCCNISDKYYLLSSLGCLDRFETISLNCVGAEFSRTLSGFVRPTVLEEITSPSLVRRLKLCGIGVRVPHFPVPWRQITHLILSPLPNNLWYPILRACPALEQASFEFEESFNDAPDAPGFTSPLTPSSSGKEVAITLLHLTELSLFCSNREIHLSTLNNLILPRLTKFRLYSSSRKPIYLRGIRESSREVLRNIEDLTLLFSPNIVETRQLRLMLKEMPNVVRLHVGMGIEGDILNLLSSQAVLPRLQFLTLQIPPRPIIFGQVTKPVFFTRVQKFFLARKSQSDDRHDRLLEFAMCFDDVPGNERPVNLAATVRKLQSEGLPIVVKNGVTVDNSIENDDDTWKYQSD